MRAFPAWSATTPGSRSVMLLKLADKLEAQQEEFARLESRNCGKPYAKVLADEIPAIVDCFRFFAGAARCLTAAAAGEYIAGFTSMIRRDAIGIVASIAPWNYPLLILSWKVAPALAAGNCVVLKPSEQTPLTALKLATLIAEIFPPGVFNLVPGRGDNVGSPLVNHPDVHMISLTGDIGTGRKMLAGGDSHAEAHPSGTGRQGAGHRLRRCRHCFRGRGRAGLRLLQRRPGLHGRLPHLCRQEDL